MVYGTYSQHVTLSTFLLISLTTTYFSKAQYSLFLLKVPLQPQSIRKSRFEQEQGWWLPEWENATETFTDAYCTFIDAETGKRLWSAVQEVSGCGETVGKEVGRRPGKLESAWGPRQCSVHSAVSNFAQTHNLDVVFFVYTYFLWGPDVFLW